MAILGARKIWRLCGLVFPVCYYFGSKTLAFWIVFLSLSFFILIEILRGIKPNFNERLFIIFKPVLKEKEKRSLLSTTWLIFSVFLTMLFFKKEFAIVAMLFLVLGDIASWLIGTYFGKISIGRHTLEGSVAFFTSCLIIGILLNQFSYIKLSWRVIILGALSATLAELFPWLDDNFTISLFSGMMMTLVSKI
ncbi:MAG: hypothetical protein NC912_01520 [Candidatus Omnitrophica bacterium]|nr:hypothetical protein [Candidatus Omnitrophota bacterium]